MGNVRTRRHRLGCEHLEGRDCPAIFVFGPVLAVLGTGGADAVSITDDGAGNVTATLNGTTRTASGIHAVVVTTFGGNDTVDYTLGDQTGYSAVAVDAGGGNDEVTLAGGDIDGKFAFAVSGGSGADTLTATLGGVGADGVAAIALDGGAGNDTTSGTAAGLIDGVLGLSLGGGFGDDTIDGSVDAAAGSTGRVVAVVAGGFGNDDLSLSVTGDDDLDFLRAVLNGGPGTDTGTATDNVTQISVENEG